jgi:hypothetical protein
MLPPHPRTSSPAKQPHGESREMGMRFWLEQAEAEMAGRP